jgi:Na+:H+ antiporter, NhaA family
MAFSTSRMLWSTLELQRGSAGVSSTDDVAQYSSRVRERIYNKRVPALSAARIASCRELWPSEDRSMMPGLSSRTSAFLHHEAAGGIVLLAAAAVALLLSNSPLVWAYDAILHTPVSVRFGDFAIDKPLLLWINDGLMAIFFFLIGLGVKREVLSGNLSSLGRAILPLIAAVGGMAVPAATYALINIGSPATLRGWAIPAATDIAFAIGVLALLGSRVPAALKTFLLALAIADDLGAIVIIALFYAHALAPAALALALAGAVILFGFNRTGVRGFAPYLIVGVFMWACVVKSGVHATLTGVALALAMPAKSNGPGPSMLERAEKALEAWVHFGVLPIFAFANAGVSLAGFSFGSLIAPIPLGISAGLFLGKQIGIFSSTWIAVKLGIAEIPKMASWRQVYGIAVLGGIGFTMSLFIGTLAFPDPAYAASVRAGVLAGSICSALLGYAVLHWSARVAPTAVAKNDRIGPA